MNFLWILFEMTVNVFQATICSGFIWKVLSSKYTGLKNTAFFISCILTQVIALIISNYYVAYDGIAIFVYYFMILLALQLLYFQILYIVSLCLESLCFLFYKLM